MFDDAIVADLREADASPTQRLLMYLDALDGEFAARSRSTVRLTIDRLNELVDGPGVSAIRVELTGMDAALAGRDEIDLSEALPDLGAQRAELRDLMTYVRLQSEGGLET